MAADKPRPLAQDPQGTALAVQSTGLAPGQTTALDPDGPEAGVRRAISAMLKGSVDAYGDVVDALICDLDTSADGLAALTWMGSTRSMLEKEQAWQAALGQLQWWDHFLAGLPDPELLSERRQVEVKRAKALRMRARIQAREAALADHRLIVAEEMATADLGMDQRRALVRAHDEPEAGQWRVDVAAYEAAALAQAPTPPDLVPIIPADLDANLSFAGFNAVAAMRAHPELAPRAGHMDQAIAATLVTELGMSKKTAHANAQVMTGIFWIALRRALGVGTHQLAGAIKLLAHADQAPVQQQFTRELLLSWLAVLEDPPFKDQRKVGAWQRLLGKRPPRELGVDAPKQLTVDDKATVWSRMKKGLGMEGE